MICIIKEECCTSSMQYISILRKWIIMKTLVLIRRILVVCGLCLDDSSNPHYGRPTNCIIVVLLTGFLAITFEYIYTHFYDIENFLYAIMQFVTFFTVWTCYICFANQKQLVYDFFENLQKIVDGYCEFKSNSTIVYIFVKFNFKKIHVLFFYYPIFMEFF